MKFLKLIIIISFHKVCFAENCVDFTNYANNIDDIQSLSNNSVKASFENLSKDYSFNYYFVKTNFKHFEFQNFNIAMHPNCNENLSLNMLKIAKEILGGISCLENLKTKKSLKYAKQLKSILQNYKRPLKIDCATSQGDMGDATPPGHPMYPTISLHQNRGVVSNASFHETLHLLGVDHSGETPEDAYACSACCEWDTKPSVKQYHGYVDREAACNLCKEDYDINSEEYIKQWEKNLIMYYPQSQPPVKHIDRINKKFGLNISKPQG